MNGYNFTERVRKVLAMSRMEAHRLGHEYVGTEHILLGLIREEEGVATAVLHSLTVDLERVQRTIEETIKTGKAGQSLGPDLPYTSRAKKVLELAMSEARELNHSYVGTEHLLIGLLREEKGIAAQVLTDAGMDTVTTRAETLRLLGTDPIRSDAERQPASRGQVLRAASNEGPTRASTTYIAAFGAPLGERFLSMRGELAWLYVKFDQYTALFGTNPARLEVLNDIAPMFFRLAQDALLADLLAGIDRLSAKGDPADGGEASLSVHSLPALVDDTTLREEITTLAGAVEQRTLFVRELRSTVAHTDVSYMIERQARLTSSSRIDTLRRALESIAAVLNRLNEHYRKSTALFHVRDYPAGGLALLHALREARDARRERRQRIEEGESLPDAPYPTDSL